MSSEETLSFNNKNKENATKQQYRPEYCQDLTKEEARIAETAKQGALEILQDALKKKDKVLMKIPETVVLQEEEEEAFWMERHTILTEDVVQKFIVELKKVKFKKNISNLITSIAYVFPRDETKTIYLCHSFWNCQKYLRRRSQPGILIHEVSHFLGAEDITYEDNTLSVSCGGSMVKGSLSPARSPTTLLLKADYWEALKKAFWNARNIQREFEVTVNHSEEYANGKYLCCGETKRYSVCESSVPDHFHTCTFQKTWKTMTLIKELHQRFTTIDDNLKQRWNILRKSLNRARIATKVGKWSAAGAIASCAGGVASLIRVALAPSACGLPTMVAAVALPMASVAAGGVIRTSKRFSETTIAMAIAQMKDLEPIIAEYKDIKRLIKSLNGQVDINPK